MEIIRRLSLTACELMSPVRHTRHKARFSSPNIPWSEQGAVSMRESDRIIEATGEFKVLLKIPGTT